MSIRVDPSVAEGLAAHLRHVTTVVDVSNVDGGGFLVVPVDFLDRAYSCRSSTSHEPDDDCPWQMPGSHPLWPDTDAPILVGEYAVVSKGERWWAGMVVEVKTGAVVVSPLSGGDTFGTVCEGDAVQCSPRHLQRWERP